MITTRSWEILCLPRTEPSEFLKKKFEVFRNLEREGKKSLTPLPEQLGILHGFEETHVLVSRDAVFIMFSDYLP